MKSSVLLKYLIELGREAYCEGDTSAFTLNAQFRALRAHRQAWRTLVPSHTETIIRDTKQLYEASGNIFAWGTGDDPAPMLSFYQAASNIYDLPLRQWDLKNLGTTFRDFAMCPDENLLVLIQEPEADMFVRPVYTFPRNLTDAVSGYRPLIRLPRGFTYAVSIPEKTILSQLIGCFRCALPKPSRTPSRVKFLETPSAFSSLHLKTNRSRWRFGDGQPERCSQCVSRWSTMNKILIIFN